MWICPVCDHKNTKNDCCSACDFDRSCSYEEFNTLASIKTGNQSIHLRKMEYRIRKHPDAFVCSKCGGIYFLLLGKDKQPTCANCGAKVAMPSPAVMEKSVAITSTIEKSTIVTDPAASGTKTIAPGKPMTANVKPSISAPNRENMSRPLKPTAASSGIYTGTQSRNKTLICKVCGYRYESAGEHLQRPIYCAVCGVRMNPELRDEILRKL